MSKPQLLVLLARQRSGTTALAETLSAGASVQSFGEIFHHRWNAEGDQNKLRLHPTASYFRFKIEMLRREPELAFPTVENQTRIFDAFMNHLGAMAQDRKWVLLDVKYNSWHHFEHVYSVTGKAPFLLHLLKKNKAAFIHVSRSRTFERYCSEQLALARGVWHSERGATLPEISIVVDPVAALRDMLESRRQVESFARFLSSIPRRIELCYEDMYAGDRLTPATEENLSRILDGEVEKGFLVPLQKVSPPLGSIIRNKDEVLNYFSDTTFASEVVQALAMDSVA
jgi:hypothetical protein